MCYMGFVCALAWPALISGWYSFGFSGGLFVPDRAFVVAHKHPHGRYIEYTRRQPKPGPLYGKGFCLY